MNRRPISECQVIVVDSDVEPDSLVEVVEVQGSKVIVKKMS